MNRKPTEKILPRSLSQAVNKPRAGTSPPNLTATKSAPPPSPERSPSPPSEPESPTRSRSETSSSRSSQEPLSASSSSSDFTSSPSQPQESEQITAWKATLKEEGGTFQMYMDAETLMGDISGSVQFAGNYRQPEQANEAQVLAAYTRWNRERADYDTAVNLLTESSDPDAAQYAQYLRQHIQQIEITLSSKAVRYPKNEAIQRQELLGTIGKLRGDIDELVVECKQANLANPADAAKIDKPRLELILEQSRKDIDHLRHELKKNEKKYPPDVVQKNLAELDKMSERLQIAKNYYSQFNKDLNAIAAQFKNIEQITLGIKQIVDQKGQVDQSTMRFVDQALSQASTLHQDIKRTTHLSVKEKEALQTKLQQLETSLEKHKKTFSATLPAPQATKPQGS